MEELRVENGILVRITVYYALRYRYRMPHNCKQAINGRHRCS
jgi:hypothetical protein